MFQRFMVAVRNAPLVWIAFATGLLVFVITRLLPGANWLLPPTEQAILDTGYIEALRGDLRNYSVLPDAPQVFGAHVLSRYLVAIVASATGDAARAGVWLSLCGIVASLGAVYAFCKNIFPLRGFAMITVVGFGGLGTLHYALSPDPSVALGMALVMWGVVFFVSSLEHNVPGRMFYSALFIGLAAYIRLELSLIWVLLAIYLIVLTFFNSAARAKGMPLVGMALGGILMVALILWPLVDRNLSLTKSTAVLPGMDAEVFFGAPRAPGAPARVSFFRQMFKGFGILMFDPLGPGIFAGLLWPLGIGVSTFINRQKAAPFLWFPLIMGMVILLSGFSFITGTGSFEESLRILTPLLFPFAVLGPVYVLFRWLQSRPHSVAASRRAWILVALGVYAMVQIPNALRTVFRNDTVQNERMQAAISAFANLPEQDRDARLLTDQPGLFLAAGKRRVYGLRGETDWDIHHVKFHNGTLQASKMIAYLRKHKIEIVHLADVGDPMIELLQQEDDAPVFAAITGFSPPHRVFRVVWQP